MNRERFETLIARWNTGAISAGETQELNALLLGDTEARRLFRRHANLDAALREWAEERAAINPWQASRATVRTPWLGTALAVAAAVTLLAGAWLWQHREMPASAPGASVERTAQGCAVLTQMLDGRFANTTHATGETLPPGRFQLASGFAQIEFFSGATLLVEGAAELELVSAWEARCVSGKVRVRVPPAARGFRLQTPGVKLVDLGTEFAVNVEAGAQTADVHVFDGEVVAHPAGRAELSLREGQSLRGGELAALDPKTFLGIGQLQELVGQRGEQRFRAWQAASETLRTDPRLIAYFPFRHFSQWERLVNNAAEPRDKSRNGGAVGATWTQGRWPGKDALQFQRPGDRVRLQIDGTYDAITFACWARVDRLDNRYNALLLTDGYEAGEPHWQIYEDGRLMFSIAYPDPAKPDAKRNQIYFSSAVFTPGSLGRWHHLAVTYDNQTGEAAQYFDGAPVSRDTSPFHLPARPIVFGPCELGNWGLPTEGHRFPVRHLEGRMDEFSLYHATLNDAEIHALYEAGQPD
jgi:hypothetical protein